MNCLQFNNTDLMERYLREELPDGELETFEAHVLECDDCAESLERLVALRSELNSRREEIEGHDSRRGFSARWLWLPLAAVLLIALGLVLVLQSRPGGELATLASIEPPIYQESKIRSSADEADTLFVAGMVYYERAEYRDAISDLEAAAALDPDRIGVRFFLGASELLIGQEAEGAEELSRVINEGDTPYLEEALFLRAQASLLLGEADAAASDLRSILELKGDWMDRARIQLEQLEALSKANS